MKTRQILTTTIAALALLPLRLCASAFHSDLVLANDKAPDASTQIGAGILLANDIGVAADGKTPPDWIEIPFGNHDHKAGVQMFDKASAEALQADFANEREKKGKRFVGLPIYVGHPDVKEFANEYKDKSAKGWIKEMEIGDDSLRLRTEWNTEGRDLVANEKFKFFSPTWSVTRVAGKTATFRPVSLKSVGLTNDPNIGVAPLTNESDPADTMPALPPWLCESLGIAADAKEEDAKAALAAHMVKSKKADNYAEADAKLREKSDETQKAHAKLDKAYQEKDAAHKALIGNCVALLALDDTAQAALLANEADDAIGLRLAALSGEHIRLKKEHGEQLATIANERKARIELLVNTAIEKGRITLAEKARVTDELSNAGEAFDAKAKELANRAPVLRVGSALTAGLGQRKETDGAATQISTLVNARMEKGEDYDTAFANVRRENAALFANMKQPEIKIAGR